MSSAVSSSAKRVSYLILIQLVSRASTFIVNQVLMRRLSPKLYGVATNLELYSSSILTFARESIRMALQRETSEVQAVINISYVPALLGVPLSTILGYWYAVSATSETPRLNEAIVLYGLAAVVELLTEPYFAVVQHKLAYGVRAKAETAATMARVFVTLVSVLWYQHFQNDAGALPFAYGQLAYAGTLMLVYTLSMLSQEKDGSIVALKAPAAANQSHYYFSLFSRPLCSVAFSMYVQSILKYFLTQGDSILIAAFASLQDQGIYAVASNYGSLIARIIFQPVEESSRNLFAKLCAPESTGKTTRNSITSAVKRADASPTPDATINGQDQHKKSMNDEQAQNILTTILRLYCIFGLVCCSVGPAAAPFLLRLVAGDEWAATGAGEVLGSYTYYIPLLATNGVSEAFVAAVADTAQLRAQSLAMSIYSLAYGGAVYLFLQVFKSGASGLIWANCINMACRILYNGRFVGRYFGARRESFDFIAILPTAGSIAAATIAGSILRIASPSPRFTSSTTFDDMLRIAIVALALAASLLLCERRFLLRCYTDYVRTGPKTD